MSKQITLSTLLLGTLILSGCSSLSSAADKMGVNFWSKATVKAPCKVASADEGILCVGTPMPKPGEAEIITLRGSFSAEASISLDINVDRNTDHAVNLAL